MANFRIITQIKESEHTGTVTIFMSEDIEGKVIQALYEVFEVEMLTADVEEEKDSTKVSFTTSADKIEKLNQGILKAYFKPDDFPN